MSNKVYVIADTHFGHKRVIEFESAFRPFSTIEEHDEFLIDAWNSTVNKKDTVWHLGDVLFGRHSFAILPRLNGIKRLVLGNHDHYPIQLYLEHFGKVFGAAQVHKCVLTHVPVHPNQLYRFTKNIHGHMHSKRVDDPRYVCVSVEQTNLRPVLLGDFA
jgi:calcineurin-like phosphoesterase family protein